MGKHILVLLLFCLSLGLVYAASDHYFKIADDIMSGKDYFAILELPETADERAIKKAYRKLSLK